MEKLAMAALIGLALAWPAAARADDDSDHDRARDLYEQGEIHALAEILEIVRERAPGEIVAIDFVSVSGKWVYRFQVIGSNGRRTIVDVDAGAGMVVHDGAGD